MNTLKSDILLIINFKNRNKYNLNNKLYSSYWIYKMVLAFLMHSKKYNCNVSITHTMDSWNSNCVKSSGNNAV